METKRVFIAFTVSEKVRLELEKVQRDFMSLNKKAHVTWANPKKMHVTVQFLGDLIEDRIEQVKQVLEKVVPKHKKFSYWLDHLDSFPNKSNPNVIVVKVGDEHREGYLLQQEIVDELKKVGIISEDKPWKPHVTIGRNKRHDNIVGFSKIQVKKQVWKIDELQLVESELNSHGPEYEIKETYKLS
jgi:RNA 2',3'-cyclic 3'-phosphodiesterase